jgi:hypothetical protein
MKSIFIAVLSAVIAVCLILSAAVSGWLGLSLTMDVRPLEAITLVTNLLIAFFLQRFIATRINDRRAEKNVLIDASTEIISLLSETLEQTDAQFQKSSINDEDRVAIISGLRRIANAIYDLQESINMSHLESVRELINDIWPQYYRLKAVATGGGFPSRGYSIHQRNLQQLAIRSLSTTFRGLIFAINDARS